MAVFGFVYTFALALGLFFSLVLLPCALLGLPVWILTIWISTVLARVERGIAEIRTVLEEARRPEEH